MGCCFSFIAIPPFYFVINDRQGPLFVAVQHRETHPPLPRYSYSLSNIYDTAKNEHIKCGDEREREKEIASRPRWLTALKWKFLLEAGLEFRFLSWLPIVKHDDELVAIFIFLFLFFHIFQFFLLLLLFFSLFIYRRWMHHVQIVIPLKRPCFHCAGLPRLRAGQEVLFPLPERHPLRSAGLCLQMVVQCRLRFVGQLLQSERRDWHRWTASRSKWRQLCVLRPSGKVRRVAISDQTNWRPSITSRRPACFDRADNQTSIRRTGSHQSCHGHVHLYWIENEHTGNSVSFCFCKWWRASRDLRQT